MFALLWVRGPLGQVLRLPLEQVWQKDGDLSEAFLFRANLQIRAKDTALDKAVSPW